THFPCKKKRYRQARNAIARIPIHLGQGQNFLGAILNVSWGRTAELKRRRNVHTRIFIPPWNISTREKVGSLIDGTQRSTPRLLQSLPDQAEGSSAHPHKIDQRDLILYG